MLDTITLIITQEDIDKALNLRTTNRHYLPSEQCPAALAGKRKFPDYEVGAAEGSLFLDVDSKESEEYYSPKLREFIKRFDSHLPVHPDEFVLAKV